jgi:hypothetical protein
MKLSSVRLGRRWRASAAGLALATAIGAAPAFAQLEWNQHALTAPNGTLFGASAAIEDNVALVGAPFDATYGLGAGAAHLYDGRLEWREVKTLFASDARRAKRFGEAVAVTANLAFVGAPGVDPSSGEVYVFDRNAGARNGWGEVARIENLGPWPFARFGAALAVWQDVLVIGAPGAADDMGRAYVLRRGRESSQWRLIRVLEPEHQGAARFGASVAVSAEWIAIGAPGATGEGSLLTGATYLYERDRGGHDGWGLAAKFAPEDGVAGQRYGRSVALGPSTLAVGAPCDPDGGSDSGAAYVYERDTDGLWPLQRKLYALDATPTASFGASLSIAGDELLVGARNAGVVRRRTGLLVRARACGPRALDGVRVLGGDDARARCGRRLRRLRRSRSWTPPRRRSRSAGPRRPRARAALHLRAADLVLLRSGERLAPLPRRSVQPGRSERFAEHRIPDPRARHRCVAPGDAVLQRRLAQRRAVGLGGDPAVHPLAAAALRIDALQWNSGPLRRPDGARLERLCGRTQRNARAAVLRGTEDLGPGDLPRSADQQAQRAFERAGVHLGTVTFVRSSP